MEKGRTESGEEGKSCRRSRKDEEGRDHICGCGKSYLSYPALYTHIKTKHEGVRPQGTFKNGSTSGVTTISSSNDLLKEDKTNGIGNMFEEDREEKELMTKAEPRISEHILKLIEEFVKSKDLRVLNKFDRRALGITNPNSRITRSQAGHLLAEKYNELIVISDEKNQESLKHFTELTSGTDLETVLVVYLLGVGRFVSEGMMQYYENFANAFINCFNKYGDEIWEETFFKKEKKARMTEKVENLIQKEKAFKEYKPDSEEEKLNKNECKYGPIIHEYFNRVYILETFTYDYYKPVMKMINEDFCKWMFANNLTPLCVIGTKNNQGFKKGLVNCRERATCTDFYENDENEFNVDVGAEVSVPKMTVIKTQRKGKMFKEKSKTLEESCQRESTEQNDDVVDGGYYEENIENVQNNEINYTNAEGYDYGYGYGYCCEPNYELQENMNRTIDEEIDQYFS